MSLIRKPCPLVSREILIVAHMGCFKSRGAILGFQENDYSILESIFASLCVGKVPSEELSKDWEQSFQSFVPPWHIQSAKALSTDSRNSCVGIFS